MSRTATAMPVVAATVLSACVEPQAVSYIFRKDTSVAKADRDYFECDVKAAKDVPADTRVATTPSYRTAMRTSCYGYGWNTTCTTTGGQVIGGETYSYDANAKLRREVWSRCMGDKGYSAVSMEVGDAKRVPEGAVGGLGDQLRSPREGACYVRVTDRIGNVVYAPEVAPE